MESSDDLAGLTSVWIRDGLRIQPGIDRKRKLVCYRSDNLARRIPQRTDNEVEPGDARKPAGGRQRPLQQAEVRGSIGAAATDEVQIVHRQKQVSVAGRGHTPVMGAKTDWQVLQLPHSVALVPLELIHQMCNPERTRRCFHVTRSGTSVVRSMNDGSMTTARG